MCCAALAILSGPEVGAAPRPKASMTNSMFSRVMLRESGRRHTFDSQGASGAVSGFLTPPEHNGGEEDTRGGFLTAVRGGAELDRAAGAAGEEGGQEGIPSMWGNAVGPDPSPTAYTPAAGAHPTASRTPRACSWADLWAPDRDAAAT